MGRNFSGYAPFRADVTDIVTRNGRNTLMIRVDATQHEGWFYEGAGIYRHAWLVKTAPLHVAHWGTFVTTTVTGARATVNITTEVENQDETEQTFRVVQTIVDSTGKSVATARSLPVRVPAWGRIDVKQQLPVVNPALWSIETPTLYKAVTVIEVAGSAVDQHETTFGMRTLHWDADQGLFLNGKHVVLKGTCNHQDHAGVGSALPDRLQYYRIECVSRRWGAMPTGRPHNPPTPELLDACDRPRHAGARRESAPSHRKKKASSQLEAADPSRPGTIRAIFAWSLANEEGSDQGNDRGRRMATTLRRLARITGPRPRPVTAAMNGGWGNGFSLVVDVQGFNYGDGASMDAVSREVSRSCLQWARKSASTVSTRGIYANDPGERVTSAHTTPISSAVWLARAETWWSTLWRRAPGSPAILFWTGFDYRGEPTPYKWPCINSHFGIMDTCGFPKDNFYYYQSWWSDKPVLHLFPHWNLGREGRGRRSTSGYTAISTASRAAR